MDKGTYGLALAGTIPRITVQSVGSMTVALVVALFAKLSVRTVASGTLGSAVTLATDAISGGLLTGCPVEAQARLLAIRAILASRALFLAFLPLVARLTICKCKRMRAVESLIDPYCNLPLTTP